MFVCVPMCVYVVRINLTNCFSISKRPIFSPRVKNVASRNMLSLSLFHNSVGTWKPCRSPSTPVVMGKKGGR